MNTGFDTCVSLAICSEILDPLVAKIEDTQVYNTDFVFLGSLADVCAVAFQ